MSDENLSYLLFGIGIVILLKNIWDYYQNSKYLNSDNMGAMMRWHFGFLLFWIFLCMGVGYYPTIEWFYGVILFPFVVVATFIFWYPTHWILRVLSLIEKRDSN
ncbi:hypothetical protein MNB_SV-6-871 [hydrothermal vent metagenome]|uniref:Uncharacterized protein n=1 Tax=hydrothermal vent metagenome TaxID=652676 RepID=A0A1W1BKX1_9ZZZZ